MNQNQNELTEVEAGKGADPSAKVESTPSVDRGAAAFEEVLALARHTLEQRARSATAHYLQAELPAPALGSRVRNALRVALDRGQTPGIHPLAVLMHPYREFSANEAYVESLALLEDVLTALLASLPHQEIDRLQQRSADRLAFALSPQAPDGKSR